MEHDIYLHNFGHYFEFILGSSFAYAGIKQVKDTVNRINFRENLTFRALEQEIKQNMVDANSVQIEFYNVTKAVIPVAEKKIKELEELNSRAERIRNGRFFQPMFYMVGAIYLTLLVLGGFQKPGWNKGIFLYAGIICVLAYMQQIVNLIMNRREIAGMERYYSERNWWRNSYRLTQVYLGCFLVGIPVCVVLTSIFPLWLYPWCESTLPSFSFWSNTGIVKNALKDICIILIICIPVLPYYFFFFRERYFLQLYYKKFDTYLDAIKSVALELRLYKTIELATRLEKENKALRATKKITPAKGKDEVPSPANPKYRFLEVELKEKKYWREVFKATNSELREALRETKSKDPNVIATYFIDKRG